MARAGVLFSEGAARFDAADYLGAIESFTQALAVVKHEGLEFEAMIPGVVSGR